MTCALMQSSQRSACSTRPSLEERENWRSLIQPAPAPRLQALQAPGEQCPLRMSHQLQQVAQMLWTHAPGSPAPPHTPTARLACCLEKRAPPMSTLAFPHLADKDWFVQDPDLHVSASQHSIAIHICPVTCVQASCLWVSLWAIP